METLQNSESAQSHNLDFTHFVCESPHKNEYSLSSCLDHSSKLDIRKELAKVSIGNHKLMIETGRYDQTGSTY